MSGLTVDHFPPSVNVFNLYN